MTRGRPALFGLGLAAAAAAGSTVAASGSPSALDVAIFGAGAAAAVLFAVLRPGAWLTALVILVLVQDPLESPAIPLVRYADEAMVLAGVAATGVRFFVRRRRRGTKVEVRVPRTPLDLPILALAAVGGLGALAEDVPPAVAALGLLAVFKGLLAFQLGARTSTTDSGLHRGLALVLGVVAAMALVGLAQRIGGEPVFRATGQAAHFATWAGGKTPAWLFNHNAFGHALVLGGSLALGMTLATTGGPRRRAGAVAALCLAGLVVAGSREAWLAGAAGVAAVAAVTRSRRTTRLAVAVTCVLVAGATAVSLQSPLMRAEAARRFAGLAAGWHAYQLGFTGHAFRGEYRVYVLLKSWDVFRDHPLWGTGPGRYGGQVAVRYPSPIYARYDFLPLDGVPQPLDVFWARLLVEFGLLGTAAFLAAFGASLAVFLAAWRSDDPLTRALGLGGVAAWAAMAVFGGFSPAFEDPLTAIPFWAWAGVAWRRWRAAAPPVRMPA